MSDVTRLRGVQAIEGVSGGEPVRVDIASIDESTLATAAKQDTQSTKLDTLHTDLGTTIAGKLDTLHSDIGTTLHADVDGLEAKLDTLHSDLDNVEPKLDTLHTDLATTLAGKLDTLHTDIGTTLHADVDGVEGKLDGIASQLPASLGAKAASASLSVAPATDAIFNVAAPENAFQTVRTWAGAVADSEPAVDGSTWVALTGASAAGYVVQLYEITAVGGTVAPTQVVFRTWIRVGGAGGVIQKIDEWTADASWLTQPAATNPYWRRIIPVNCDDIFVTATFPDGTSPTITGTVKCRAIAHAGLQRRDFTYDPATGLPKFQSASYDSATQTEKVSDSYKECDLPLCEPAILNSTGLAHTTPITYYPSSDGAIMDGWDSISFQYSLAAGGGGTIETWWEIANADVWTLATDCTLAASNNNTGDRPAATPLSSGTTLAGFMQFDNLNAKRIRQCVLPKTANSGAVVINMRRKVRGS